MADTQVSHNNHRIFIRTVSFLGCGLEVPGAGVEGLALRFNVDVLFRVGLDLKGPIAPRIPVTIALHLAPLNLGSKRNEKSHVLLPYHSPEVLGNY